MEIKIQVRGDKNVLARLFDDDGNIVKEQEIDIDWKLKPKQIQQALDLPYRSKALTLKCLEANERISKIKDARKAKLQKLLCEGCSLRRVRVSNYKFKTRLAIFEGGVFKKFVK